MRAALPSFPGVSLPPWRARPLFFRCLRLISAGRKARVSWLGPFVVPDHSPENLRLAHRWCNAVRGDETYYSADILVTQGGW